MYCAMSWAYSFLIASLPVLIVTAVLWACEWVNGQRDTDWRLNLQAWVLARGMSVVVLPLVPLWASAKWSLIDGSALPFWQGFAIFLITRDLMEYLFHRAQHSIPLLWAMHSLHHSDPDMMVLTNQRQFWGDQFIKQVTIWPLCLTIISPTPEIIAAFGVFGLLNLFLHSGLPINFGRWSWVLNSPEYHRIHHSRDPEHINSNFATLLPIFDVLFGSYRVPTGHPETGLDIRPANFVDIVIWPVIHSRHTIPEQATPADTADAKRPKLHNA